jgi:hypothetical protein
VFRVFALHWDIHGALGLDRNGFIRISFRLVPDINLTMINPSMPMQSFSFAS